MQFTFWPPIAPFVAFAFGWAWWQSRELKPAWKIFQSLLYAAIAFAIGEAAAFHTGDHARNWLFAAILIAMVGGAVALLVVLVSKRQTK